MSVEDSELGKLQRQLSELDMTIGMLKAEVIRAHNLLITELNQTVGSVETFKKLNQNEQKEQTRKSGDGSYTGGV
jgi:hypothetical protein